MMHSAKPKPEKLDEAPPGASWRSTRQLLSYVVLTSLTAAVIALSKDTIIWIWGAVGDFLQENWLNIYNWFEGDEVTLMIVGTFVTTNTIFWGESALLGYLDLKCKPKWLHKYKVQQDKNVPLAVNDWKRAVKVAFINLDVITAPFLLMAVKLMQWRGCSFGAELPTLGRLLLDLAGCIMVEEFGFYYSHRLFHHPFLYKHIHKMHHEWTAPISLVSVYAHPVEHIVAFIIPPLLGPVVMASHITTAWLWYCLALSSTNFTHSGYHFPFCPSPEKHDFHHLKFNCNYGVLGLLDWLHGTDKLFLSSRQYQEHFVIYGTKTAKEIVDEKLSKDKNFKVN